MTAKKIVVKYGGSVDKGKQDGDDLLEEIAYFSKLSGHWAIVHGGGAEISHWLARLGHSSEFREGQRVTDDVTMDIVEMVLAGRVGKRIMRELEGFGVKAISCSGEDHGLLQVTPFSGGAYGRVGEVYSVQAELLNLFWQAAFVPVIAPLGVDPQQRVFNINADLAAGHIASAVQADVLVIATDVPGVKESSESRSVIPELTESAALAMIQNGSAAGGMIPKLQAAITALQGGAKEVFIVDGRQQGNIDLILRGNTVGTRIVQDRERRIHHV